MALKAKDWLFYSAIALPLLLISLLSQVTHAESGRSNYDLDGDGLIEINDLFDLDEIRNNLDGKSLYGSSVGCPEDGCSGFELTRDLDFDTNQNGKIDEGDAFWNANDDGVGEGWEPIGEYNNRFTSIFNGNGYRILNLHIYRPESFYVGLFGSMSGGELRGVGLTGPLTIVHGSFYVGALVGHAGTNSTVAECYSTGMVYGKSEVGGLIGKAYDLSVEKSFTTGYVEGVDRIGGLAGELGGEIVSSFSTSVVKGSSSVGGLIGGLAWNAKVKESFSSGFVAAAPTSGGLIGFSYDHSQSIRNSYWAATSSGQNNSFLKSEQSSYVGLSLSVLQCPVKGSANFNHSTCVSQDGTDEGLENGVTVFNGWEASGSWNFGNENQLPGLIINGVIYRDSDGDGVLDDFDDAPNNYAYSLDYDGDGHPDAWSLGCHDNCQRESGLSLDQFPTNKLVWKDLDLDGLVDVWPESCDEMCKEQSGLTLDNYLSDTDNDGVPNSIDLDDNGDQKQDVDSDGDGLVEIETLEQLNAVRFQLDGAGYRASLIDDLDTTGCPIILYEGRYQNRCKGYELVNDLDFDMNGDGVINELDPYWNTNEDGIAQGWLPIGGYRIPFTGLFEGNHHLIKNLYINRAEDNQIGLFGAIDRTSLQNFGVAGRLTKVIGEDYVGGIVGWMNHLSSVKGVFNTGEISGRRSVGGVVGYANSYNAIENSFNTGDISTYAFEGQNVGGVAGKFWKHNSIKNVFNSGAINGNSFSGGVLGYGYSTTDISSSYNAGLVIGEGRGVGGLAGSLNLSGGVVQNSYWATDSSNRETSDDQSKESSYVGLPLLVLQCATENQFSNRSCVDADSESDIYHNWNQERLIWDFGSEHQLPGLVLNQSVYRDSDADGVLDHEDKWPHLFAAAIDDDQDGYPDNWNQHCDESCIAESGLILDQFPESAAGWKDEDLDGLLDEWAESCNAECQVASGLDLDAYLLDGNNDGISDFSGNDDNGDGLIDADADSDGLIDIRDLNQLHAIRFQLDGLGRRLSEDGELDSSGCPIRVVEGISKKLCIGYELVNDLEYGNSFNEGRGWIPIGDNETPFSSIFEGNDYSIENLRIDAAYKAYSGLFGYIENSRISNLSLRNVNVFLSRWGLPNEEYAYAGALVGYASKGNEIYNIYSSGRVTGMQIVGGIIGSVGKDNHVAALHNQSIVRFEGVGSVYGVGGVVGSVWSNNVLMALFNSGEIEVRDDGGNDRTGGLIGSVGSNNEILASLNTGSISSTTRSTSYVGGLIGYLGSQSLVQSSYNTAHIQTLEDSFDFTGGIIGNQDYSNAYQVENSYWVQDTANPVLNYISDPTTSTIGLPLRTLQCSTSANTNPENNDCISSKDSDKRLSDSFSLFKDWDVHTLNGIPVWDFGSKDQLPALNLYGVIKRDSDGDGHLDDSDAFPNSWEAAIDTDGDGYPDAWSLGCGYLCQKDSKLFHDYFPYDSTVGKDDDNDGLIDEWSKSCDSECQSSSRWTLDEHLNDSDNDGIVNSVDEDDDGDGRVDVDRDNNGLIEITTLAQLNAMRYQLDGIGFRESEHASLNQSGCPHVFFEGAILQRCTGYELKNDLDFDTNGDDLINGRDQYWNNGEGWEPIGKSTNYVSSPMSFTAQFDGNGYQIRNLYINRPTEDGVGLFGSVKNTVIKELGLTGSSMSITGDSRVGSLIGEMRQYSIIQGVFSGGVVSGNYSAGGLVGFARRRNHVSDSFSTANIVDGPRYSNWQGGLIGSVFSSNLVINSFSSGGVSGHENSGGLIGRSFFSPNSNHNEASPNKVVNSYWAKDSSFQNESAGLPKDENYKGYILHNLQCPQTSNQTIPELECFKIEDHTGSNDTSYILYKNWDEQKWDFGTANQLPGLILNGVVYRDSDGDGILDGKDPFIFDPDNDGIFDENDAFPFSFAASVDNDSDGMPDEWNINCDQECQISSLLTLDTKLNDSDNDGVANDIDAFIFNAAAATDTDGDGNPDTWLLNCDARCQQSSGLQLDMDDDDDGIADDEDAFPLRHEVSIDLDGDGFPDKWNEACDESCRIASGIQIDRFVNDSDNDGILNDNDAFPDNFAASVDADNDGLPDRWNVACDIRCQEESGLELDASLDDTDNDGVVNAQDAFENNPAAAIDTDGDGRPDSWLDGCDVICQSNSGLTLDLDDDNDYILDLDDAFPTNFAASIDNDLDGLPDSWNWRCNANCQSNSGLKIDQNLNDTDNDGVINSLDDLPNNAAASVDSDKDGKPDSWNRNCNAICQKSSGLEIDLDNDNDLILDELDAFRLNPAASVDSDNDGHPDLWNDSCDLNCQSNSGLSLDPFLNDTDNDSYENQYDDFAYNSAASMDTDGDGRPDHWNSGCSDACQESSGLSLDNDDDNDGVPDNEDAFSKIFAVSKDTDKDGLADEWNQRCYYSCQTESNLTLDDDDDNDGTRDENDAFPKDASEFLDTDGDGIGNNQDSDDDNDGVPDERDTDLANDNGAPDLIQVPEDLVLQVTTKDGSHAVLNWSQEYYSQFRAYDAVDAYDVTYEAKLNGNEDIDISEDSELKLPAGKLELLWRAKDKSGNYSNSIIQTIKVYPEVRFTLSESVTGDESMAELEVELSGDSPEYPVDIEFSVNFENSDVVINQADFTDDFDIESMHRIRIGYFCSLDCEYPNNLYLIPVAKNSIGEFDELVTFNLVKAYLADDPEKLLIIDEDKDEHELTIAQGNLAPEVQLTLEQRGQQIVGPITEDGVVTIRAFVSDKNDLDEHEIEWDLGSIADYTIDFDRVHIRAENLASGDYPISVRVSDLVEDSLTAEAKIMLSVDRPAENEESSAGSLSLMWFMFLSLILYGRIAFRSFK